MTRKDLELIAKTIKGTRYVGDTHMLTEEMFAAGINAACGEIADVLAVALAEDNPRFDRARFLQACK